MRCPKSDRRAKTEITIASARYGDKLMQWLTFAQTRGSESSARRCCGRDNDMHRPDSGRFKLSSRMRSMRRKRLGGAPQQLVADRERAEVLRTHRQLAQPADRESSSCRSPPPASGRACVGFAVVRHDLHPLRCRRRSCASMSASGTSFFSLNVSAWLWQRIAPMRTQKPSTGTAGAPNRDALAEDLVGLGAALPLLAAGAVAAGPCRSRDQAAAERHAEVGGLGPRQRALLRRRRGGRSRGSPTSGRRAAPRTSAWSVPYWRQQLAHVLRAAARRRLVGRACSSTRPGRP